ncbi:MAG: hypothetical protein AABX88_03005 [Nanoarchaeota archaeon]
MKKIKIPSYLSRKNLEEAIEYVKESGDNGRIYRQGEVGNILDILECLGCIKSHDAGVSGVDPASGSDEVTKDLLWGCYLVKYTYVKDLPKNF